MMRLSRRHKQALLKLGEGWLLKSHRYLDGTKRYQLHSPEGAVVDVQRKIVSDLVHNDLISSNQKFPAATYLLTEKGRQTIAALNTQD